MTIHYIPWSRLTASPRNVRRVKTGIDSLAASIAADGLLQNLTVIPRDDGKFEVIAGERRRRAIVRLVRARQWPKDSVVPCEVRKASDATALSYAENAQRVAMHPADAIRAFGQLAAEGADEAAIAHRYGYDPREVRRMLALANVSPKVLSALAADRIDLETAQAFTLTDDHVRQDRVLRHARGAYDVRRQLTDAKLTTGDRRFRFVGAAAYAEAGGTVTRDLFSTEDGGYADDPALVERLAAEKLDRAAEAARAENWGEVIAAEAVPYESYRWHRLYPDQDGDYSIDARGDGRLLLTIGRDGEIEETAYRMKAPRADRGPSPALLRPLYSARLTDELSQARTAALQAEVARNRPVALAVLLDALLPLSLGQHDGNKAVRLRGEALPHPMPEHVSTRPIPGPFDALTESLAAVPDAPEERFAWLLGLDQDSTLQLLTACAGALLDATQGGYADPSRMQAANRVAEAVGLDMRQHWAGGIEFYACLTRKAMLAALAEGCGPEAAANCAKLKQPELARACVERLAGRGWLPPALRAPEDADSRSDVAAVDDKANEREALAA